ncbi:twin transmembrane helix small protein [Kordiimonas marina]|uniref:twin transmembrane helix small protein n=1 Tax=Kordiimonas marina TaxID=2872312 RepID=UPI001FF53F3A|nr:twin transmembrane helix small protein [Kordiimonas marina]MCJ9428421.1 twin transmembrane helix small protein [Kordiimonas marina]
MKAVFILAILTMFATLGILITGVITMARGGEFNKKWGNKLMRLRIAFQAVTVLLIFILALAASHN